MIPQVLFISTNSRTRRVYHTIVEQEECEFVTAKSVADSLVQLVAHRIDVIAIDSELPIFEICMFFEVIAKKNDWKTLPIVVFHHTEQRHLFPQSTRFAETETEFVRFLKECCATL